MSRFPSPQGEAVAVSAHEPETQSTRTFVLELGTGRRVTLGRTPAGGIATGVDWRPDGRRLAFIDGHGVLRVVDWRRRALIKSRRLVDADVSGYSADGTRPVIRTDRGLAVFDTESMKPLTDPVLLEGREIGASTFGPGDDTAVVFTADQPRFRLRLHHLHRMGAGRARQRERHPRRDIARSPSIRGDVPRWGTPSPSPAASSAVI